jgi:hypothetical protein
MTIEPVMRACTGEAGDGILPELQGIKLRSKDDRDVRKAVRDGSAQCVENDKWPRKSRPNAVVEMKDDVISPS